jgi:hypothetical protein
MIVARSGIMSRRFAMRSIAIRIAPMQRTRSPESIEQEQVCLGPANFQHGVLLARDIGRQADAVHAASMTRIYDVPTVALVLLREHDYVTDRALVTVTRESVNSTVRDWPACLEVWLAPSGNCRCFLTWWTPRMMYLLQTWTSSRKPDSGARLITDYALEMVPFLATTARRSSSLRRYIDPEWLTRAFRQKVHSRR